MDNYFLSPDGNGWKLSKQGADRPIKTFDTKDEALKFAQDYFSDKTASLKIQKQDGTFQEERTYPRSADPRSSKG